MEIRSDRQKGMSYVELGKKYHIDPRTAKRYAESPQKPEYTLSEPKRTKMDPKADRVAQEVQNTGILHTDAEECVKHSQHQRQQEPQGGQRQDREKKSHAHHRQVFQFPQP